MSDNNIESIDSIEDDNSTIDSNNSNEEEGTGINWGKVLDMDRADGVLDLDATMARLRTEAEMFIEQNELPIEQLAAAIEKAYRKIIAREKVDTVKMQSLIGRAVMELDIPISSETRIGKLMSKYLQTESAAFYETNGNSSNWIVGKGRGGGVRFITETYRAEYKAELAAAEAVAAAKAKLSLK